MAKRNVEPRFLPCVATHYRNVTVNMSKKLADVQDGITEHNGHLAPEIMDALVEAQRKITELALLLDARSSKRMFEEETAQSTESAS